METEGRGRVTGTGVGSEGESGGERGAGEGGTVGGRGERVRKIS